MDVDELFSHLKVEVVGVCGGHMGTTTYFLVGKYEGRVVIKVQLGFNNGDELGFQVGPNRMVSSESEI